MCVLQELHTDSAGEAQDRDGGVDQPRQEPSLRDHVVSGQRAQDSRQGRWALLWVRTASSLFQCIK